MPVWAYHICWASQHGEFSSSGVSLLMGPMSLAGQSTIGLITPEAQALEL